MDFAELKNKALNKKRLFKKIAAKLRKKNNQTVDKLFRELHDIEVSEIDCLDCAGCCKNLGPRLNQTDIDRLAKHLKIKSKDVFTNYLRKDEDGDIVFRSVPCPFLDDNNYCIVYSSRPKACKEYPHTDSKNIKSILSKCVKNTEYCPIVYNVFNKLEKEDF